MAISMVREPSETPNINNVDDFVGLRYAYGDQNGYVKGFGNECSNTINGNIFHINSGRLVLQGVECNIDANGVDITIDPVSATRYYVIYLQVNLSTNQVSILSTHSPSAYPTISAGDDLTENNTGTARLEVYRFVAINGTISNISKTVKEIIYINKSTRIDRAETVTNGVYTTDFNNSNQTKIGDYIIPKYKLLKNSLTKYTYTGGENIVIYTDANNVYLRKFRIELYQTSPIGDSLDDNDGTALLVDVRMPSQPNRGYGCRVMIGFTVFTTWVEFCASDNTIVCRANTLSSSDSKKFAIGRIYEIFE